MADTARTEVGREPGTGRRDVLLERAEDQQARLYALHLRAAQRNLATDSRP